MNKNINKLFIYQGEQDLQDEYRTLANPDGFQVNEEIPMSSGQISQVRNFRVHIHKSLVFPYNVIRQIFSSNLYWTVNGLGLASKFQ